MRFTLLVLAAALLAAPAPAHAQRLADAAFPGLEVPASLAPDTAPGQPRADSATAPASRTRRFLARTGLAGVGMVGGAAVVGLGAYAVFPHCDSCEDPGLTGLLLGGLVGAAAGTAVFAALPAMGDGCSYLDRLGRAVLGAGAGTGLGLLGAWATGLPPLVLLGSTGGSAYATLGCRERAPETR